MRQVGRDELIQTIAAAMRKVRPELIKMLTDHRDTERLRGRVALAGIIVDSPMFRRLEVLSDAPEGPPVHYGALDGGSGIPPQDPDSFPPATRLF